MITKAITNVSLSIHANRGFVVFLGAGISRSSGLKDAWQILTCLIQKQQVLEEPDSLESPEDWYFKMFRKRPTYSDVLQNCGNRASRRAILRPFFQHGNGVANAEPTKAHRAIAELAKAGFVKVIVTTNFDRLTESAFQEIGLQPKLIYTSADALNIMDDYIDNSVWIVKINGDYNDINFKNTEEELEFYTRPITKLLTKLLNDRCSIFCGWSADHDRALRNIVLGLKTKAVDRFWLAYQGFTGEFATKLIENKEIVKIPISSADDAFEKIKIYVSALSDMERENMQELPVFIKSLKHAIDNYKDNEILLRTWIRENTEAVVENLIAINSQVNLLDHSLSATDQIRRYQETCLKYSYLVGLLWRYRGVTYREDILMSLRALIECSHSPVSGDPRNLKLRLYPVQCVLKASLVAALCARDWVCAKEILSLKIRSGDDSNKYINWYNENLTEHRNSMQSFILEISKTFTVTDEQAINSFHDMEALVGMRMFVEHGRLSWQVHLNIAFDKQKESLRRASGIYTEIFQEYDWTEFKRTICKF